MYYDWKLGKKLAHGEKTSCGITEGFTVQWEGTAKEKRYSNFKTGQHLMFGYYTERGNFIIHGVKVQQENAKIHCFHSKPCTSLNKDDVWNQ